jgi:hypothetical protein
MSGNATDSTKIERNRTERDRLTAHSGRAALRAALDCFWYLPLLAMVPAALCWCCESCPKFAYKLRTLTQ